MEMSAFIDFLRSQNNEHYGTKDEIEVIKDTPQEWQIRCKNGKTGKVDNYRYSQSEQTEYDTINDDNLRVCGYIEESNGGLLLFEFGEETYGLFWRYFKPSKKMMLDLAWLNFDPQADEYFLDSWNDDYALELKDHLFFKEMVTITYQKAREKMKHKLRLVELYEDCWKMSDSIKNCLELNS